MAPFPERRRRAIALALLASACFAVMNGGIKHLAATYTTGQILFLRNLLALLPAVVVLLLAGGTMALRTRRPGGHVFRALFGITSMFCLFASFRSLRLTDALALNFMAPLILTLLSKAVLRDPVGARAWVAVALGFGGVLVIIRPGWGVVETAGLLALLSAFFNALGLLAVRQLGATEAAATTLFYYSAAAAVFTAPLAVLGWRAVVPGDLPLFLLVGTAGGVAQYLTIEALRVARPAVVTPVQYTLLVWAGVIDFLVWSAMPDATALAGIALIVSASVLVLAPAETPRPSRVPAS